MLNELWRKPGRCQITAQASPPGPGMENTSHLIKREWGGGKTGDVLVLFIF